MGLKFWTFAFCAFSTVVPSTFANNAYAQTYGGRATGINATTTINGLTTTTVLPDTGPLLNWGGIRYCGKSLTGFQSVNSASEI